MKNTKNGILCLVAISIKRNFKKGLSTDEARILRRLEHCFPTLKHTVDTVPGTFNLNQDFYEIFAPLATSFGLMDFIALPLADSVWLNYLFVSNKIDIKVNYVYNFDTEKADYIAHASFPDKENLTLVEFTHQRASDFNKALDDMLKKNGLIN